MGLNIGIEALVYLSEEPKLPDPQEVETEFFKFLHERFLEGGFGGGWVSRKEVPPLGGGHHERRIEWDFDVRLFAWGQELEAKGYTSQQMYQAIFEFIIERFPIDSLDLHVYWSG